MGGTKSKATINQLSGLITNIAVNNVASCLTTSRQNQNITITNDGFRFWTNYKIKQTSYINVSCVQNANFQTRLQNDIINAIAQTTSSEGVALLSAFGRTTSEATTNLTNIVQNNIKVSNIMETVSEVEQTQNIKSINNYVWIFDNLEAVQGSEVFAAATLKSVQDAGIFNTIENKIDQEARAKETNPLAWIGNIASTIALVLLFIVLVIFAIIYGGRAKTGGSDILVCIKN